jgi:[acyl-carrier-protein] S-malonyltransferase
VSEVIEGNVAMVFPGQGSQFVGMGRALIDSSAAAHEVYNTADEILGFPLSQLMLNGPTEQLEDTINAQPAILTASVAALEAIRDRIAGTDKTLSPAMVAGHSLGEFTALVAAGALDFPAALRLVRERGRLMKEAGDEAPGGMAAVLGLDEETLGDVCKQAASEGVVVIANANCPGQIVISGEVAALVRAMELAKAAGAKRVARLEISIASHSPLMAHAAAQFAVIVTNTMFSTPHTPVVANVSASPMTTVQQIREELSVQIERPVNWTGSVRTMLDAGITAFVEVGPGNVLAGLNKRISRETPTLSIVDLGLDLPPAARSA